MRPLHVLVAAVVLSVAFTPAASAQQGPPPGSFEITAESGTAVVPFEMHKELIVLTGTVNGATVKLHLDTGFANDGAMLWSSPQVDAMNFTYVGKVQVGGGGGEEFIPSDLAAGQVVELPGIRLTQQMVLVMPFDSLRHQAFRDVQGFIGGSLFNHLVVGIDYERREITLSDPDGYRYSGSGRMLPLGVRADLARTLPIRVETTDGTTSTLTATVDLGAAHVLSINANACDSISIPPGAIEYTLGAGLVGEEVGHIGRIKKIGLGDYSMSDVVCAFSTSPWLEQIEGQANLGSEYFQRFHVVFDYARDRVILEPNSRYAEPFEFNMSGLGLKKLGTGEFQVARIVPDSPGSEASFRLEDVVTAIDGEPATTIDRDELKELLRRPGRTVVFSVRRGDRQLALNVTLRRII